MKNKSYTLILTILILTNGCKKTIIKLTDIKFDDFEKEALVANKIDKTVLLAISQTLKSSFSDTIGYNTYDTNGNLLIEQRNFFSGHYVGYDYDTNGFVQNKLFATDFSARFKMTYLFVPDSLVFYQYWNNSDWKGIHFDTCIFRFDANGLLLEAIEYANDDHGRGKHFRTTYEYNNSNRIHRKASEWIIAPERIRIREKEYGESISTLDTTNYFYSSEKLDSTVQTYYFPSDPRQNYTLKTLYNDNGLISKTIQNDTLVIAYVHRTRTN